MVSQQTGSIHQIPDSGSYGDDHFAILFRDVERPDPGTGVNLVTPGLKVKLPEMPRAMDGLAFLIDDGEVAMKKAFAEWTTFVNTAVTDAVELTLDVENRNRKSINLYNFSLTFGNLAGRCNSVLRHSKSVVPAQHCRVGRVHEDHRR